MMLPCDICGKSGHPWFDCALRVTKPVGWKPERLTKRAEDVPAVDNGDGTITLAKPISSGMVAVPAAMVQIIVTAKKPGRPSTGFDKKAYDRQKAAERRAAAREAKK